jgi:hypothetical protein
MYDVLKDQFVRLLQWYLIGWNDWLWTHSLLGCLQLLLWVTDTLSLRDGVDGKKLHGSWMTFPKLYPLL